MEDKYAWHHCAYCDNEGFCFADEDEFGNPPESVDDDGYCIAELNNQYCNEFVEEE